MRLDEVLGAKVGAQVHDLPGPQGDEQPGGADAEPLDARVCALVCVAQLLLAHAQVVHLLHDLGRELLDAAQLGLDGLELLRGLDGGPVLGVGADVDVELDVAEGRVGPVGCGRALDGGGSRRRCRGCNVQPDRMFSKQTSKWASSCEVKTERDSPTTSLGRAYSLPRASRI